MNPPVHVYSIQIGKTRFLEKAPTRHEALVQLWNKKRVYPRTQEAILQLDAPANSAFLLV